MADEDDREREWQAAQADKTVADDAGAVPVAVSEANTPRPETTGRHRMTPAMFASAIDLTDRDAYARGLEHGRAAARADAEAAVVTELRQVREDAIETMRQLWVIFEITIPDWPTAERWIRSRMTPL